MSLPLIVMGDRTTHGGTVITADLTFDINGKNVARVGDMTVCPKCAGTFKIKSGAGDLVDGEGLGYARHMDQTECGAKLISSQITTTWDNKTMLGILLPKRRPQRSPRPARSPRRLRRVSALTAFARPQRPAVPR